MVAEQSVTTEQGNGEDELLGDRPRIKYKISGNTIPSLKYTAYWSRKCRHVLLDCTKRGRVSNGDIYLYKHKKLASSLYLGS